MTRKRFQTGLRAIDWNKTRMFLSKIGLRQENFYWYPKVRKAVLYGSIISGAVWYCNETSPFGWWTLKPRPKEEKELAHLYDHRQFPYPGDEEAMEEFIANGGMIGSVVGPKGFIEVDKDGVNFQKMLQNEKLEQEAHKLWLRMRNEVITELQEKGFDIQ